VTVPNVPWIIKTLVLIKQTNLTFCFFMLVSVVKLMVKLTCELCSKSVLEISHYSVYYIPRRNTALDLP